ncbi:HAMP domain-containing protein [Legionella israelensis]|uniref:histidine kinase n=1 Tax=Legionella israelensis TaxID=454 RepID=A0A0W0VL90_9GAMM|nr:ATP-binding protein [Legionella israelensis]KTD20851.1 sensor histidine kinase CpxA [Legionella israelensis]QBR84224.1 HAMP domain-containing protein [Legionella israelensis]QBS08485.1 HAMP domain-containing protein [Legionella israelensis]QDP72669.1 HAMP domain-containing protein [Legionella israelensis]SCY27184.1 two-component system, OmpR family, sensor histidine kinase CpxA [Legionella israelensis DSM 19235]
MRSLYWKIFLSFWLATILIIITTAWFTGQIAKKSSLPVREQLFMDSYANAAVATFESGKRKALIQWLQQIGLSRHMNMFLISSTGEIIGSGEIPPSVRSVSENLILDQLNEGIFKTGNLIVSHEILSTSGKAYRLAAVTEKPISHFVEIPWAGLTIRVVIAIFFSGLICYLLSLYLTQPLRSLRIAAKSIATGKLNTRVGKFIGHHKDEIAALSREFDRMAEQLETIVNSKQRLLQDISHELRSPLARLNIAIELAKNKTGGLAETEFSRMETESYRLNALIGEILEFARLDKSTTVLHLTLVDLPELLKSIIQDANYEFADKNERIKAGQIQSCQLYLDKKLIHRAIENILRNALRYSDKPVILSLEYDDEKKNVLIKIKDRGPGVPEDQLTRIFNPFYRVDTSREKKTGGYGLGLAIASQAIKLHQGKITAENRKKGGLLVCISLPVK